MLDLLVMKKKVGLNYKKQNQLYHCKSLIKDVKTFFGILWFHFSRFLHIVLVVQGQRERRAGESKNPPLPSKLSRFEWEGIKAVICWLMSLQWVQTQTSLVPPHLHLYGAAHNSSAPVGRTELLLSDPADVSAATPRHLPPSAGGREGGSPLAREGRAVESGGEGGQSARASPVCRAPEYHLVSCQLDFYVAFSETLANRPQRRQIINSSHLLRHATKADSLLPLQHF